MSESMSTAQSLLTASPMTDKEVLTFVDGQVKEIRELLKELTRELPNPSKRVRDLATKISRKNDRVHRKLSTHLNGSGGRGKGRR